MSNYQFTITMIILLISIILLFSLLCSLINAYVKIEEFRKDRPIRIIKKIEPNKPVEVIRPIGVPRPTEIKKVEPVEIVKSEVIKENKDHDYQYEYTGETLPDIDLGQNGERYLKIPDNILYIKVNNIWEYKEHLVKTH